MFEGETESLNKIEALLEGLLTSVDAAADSAFAITSRHLHRCCESATAALSQSSLASTQQALMLRCALSRLATVFDTAALSPTDSSAAAGGRGAASGLPGVPRGWRAFQGSGAAARASSSPLRRGGRAAVAALSLPASVLSAGVRLVAVFLQKVGSFGWKLVFGAFAQPPQQPGGGAAAGTAALPSSVASSAGNARPRTAYRALAPAGAEEASSADTLLLDAAAHAGCIDEGRQSAPVAAPPAPEPFSRLLACGGSPGELQPIGDLIDSLAAETLAALMDAAVAAADCSTGSASTGSSAAAGGVAPCESGANPSLGQAPGISRSSVVDVQLVAACSAVLSSSPCSSPAAAAAPACSGEPAAAPQAWSLARLQTVVMRLSAFLEALKHRTAAYDESPSLHPLSLRHCCKQQRAEPPAQAAASTASVSKPEVQPDAAAPAPVSAETTVAGEGAVSASEAEGPWFLGCGAQHAALKQAVARLVEVGEGRGSALKLRALLRRSFTRSYRLLVKAFLRCCVTGAALDGSAAVELLDRFSSAVRDMGRCAAAVAAEVDAMSVHVAGEMAVRRRCEEISAERAQLEVAIGSVQDQMMEVLTRTLARQHAREAPLLG